MNHMKRIIIKLLRFLGIKANEGNLKRKNIKRFLQAKWRKLFQGGACLLDDTTPLDEDISTIENYKKEQIKWRYHMLQTHPQGKQCLAKGECPCECTTLEVLLADDTCDQGCYPKMMNEKQWKEFKKTNKLC